jgi:deoxyribodipyrimidine photo-lyase
VFSSELAWRDFYADVLFQQPRTAWENLNRKMDAMPVDTDAAARERGSIAGRRARPGSASSTPGCAAARDRLDAQPGADDRRQLPGQGPASAVAVGCALVHAAPVDGDLASNNHGWQWAAGTGTDAAPYFRVFNPTLQQERYDPDGSTSIAGCPNPVEPMLDHKAERNEALRRLEVAR